MSVVNFTEPAEFDLTLKGMLIVNRQAAVMNGGILMSDYVYTVDELKTCLLPIFENYSIKRAVLFGSYGKGEAGAKSDIDLLVDSGLKGLHFVGFVEELRSSLDKDMDVFDVTHLEEGTSLDSEIRKGGVVLYEK